jgi:hypothetical protein
LLKYKVDLWIAEQSAVTDAECTEIENAVHCQWRVDRCRRADAAANERILDGIENDYLNQILKDVNSLIPQLATNPAVVVHQLAACSPGLMYMRQQWQILGDQFAARGYLEPGQRRHAIHLHGLRPCDLFDDPIVLHITRLDLGAGYAAAGLDGERAASILQKDRPDGMIVQEFQRRLKFVCQTLLSSEESRTQIQAFIARQIAGLDERLELVRLREQRDQALAYEEATVDVSPAGRNRMRYELAHLRAKDAAMRQFRTLRDDRLKLGAPPDATAHKTQPPAHAEATVSTPDGAANLVAQTEPKPRSSSCPAEGSVTSAEPVAVVAVAAAVPSDATPAPTVDGSTEPQPAQAVGPAEGHPVKVATADNHDSVVVAPQSAAEGRSEERRSDRTGTSQAACSTTGNAKPPGQPDRGGKMGQAELAELRPLSEAAVPGVVSPPGADG